MELTKEFHNNFIEAFEACIDLFKEFDPDQENFEHSEYAKGFIKAMLTDSIAGITLTCSITGYFIGKGWDVCDYDVEDIIVLLNNHYELS